MIHVHTKLVHKCLEQLTLFQHTSSNSILPRISAHAYAKMVLKLSSAKVDRWQLCHVYLQAPIRPENHISHIARTILIRNPIGQSW